MRKITIIMDDELIDSGFNDDEKEKTFLHECRHIFRGDFLKPGNVQEIEKRTHFGA